MEVLDCIKNRRSVRKFSDKMLDREVILDLINISISAPTAQMLEPWGFVIIQDKEELKKISDRAKEMALEKLDSEPQFKAYEKYFLDPEYNIFYESNNLVIIYGNTDTRWYMEDCSLVASNMILAGFDKNIGSCWIGFGEFLFNSEEFKKEYNIPSKYKVVAPLILGYMNYTPKPPTRKEPIIFEKN